VRELSEAELDALISDATVDCYSEDEQMTGFAVMIRDNLAPVRPRLRGERARRRNPDRRRTVEGGG
jgi:hypothetical protein